MKVPSLATGVKGKGLADILKNAENLMKDGKFTSALDQYDEAEQVAPNNPLTRSAAPTPSSAPPTTPAPKRTFATSSQKNPELLVGQYDLTDMLGEQRMQVLVKDLKEIANREQKEAASGLPAGVHRLQHRPRAERRGVSRPRRQAQRREGPVLPTAA